MIEDSAHFAFEIRETFLGCLDSLRITLQAKTPLVGQDANNVAAFQPG